MALLRLVHSLPYYAVLHCDSAATESSCFLAGHPLSAPELAQLQSRVPHMAHAALSATGLPLTFHHVAAEPVADKACELPLPRVCLPCHSLTSSYYWVRGTSAPAS